MEKTEQKNVWIFYIFFLNHKIARNSQNYLNGEKSKFHEKEAQKVDFRIFLDPF